MKTGSGPPVRILASTLLAVALLSGCAQTPPPVETPVSPPAVQNPPPVYSSEPRLLLNLPVGSQANRPALFPGRVGGVSERGPITFAVTGSGEVHLLDAAGSRLLVYADGKLTRSIHLPWLGENGARLLWLGDQYLLTDGGTYVFTRQGHLVHYENPGGPDLYSNLRPAVAYTGKDALDLGADAQGRRYERVVAQDGSFRVIRKGADGQPTASVSVPPHQPADWYLTPGGGLYLLAWDPAAARVQVWELFGPGADSVAPSLRIAPAEPVAFGLPVPQKIELIPSDWKPMTLSEPAELFGLWVLLARMRPESMAHPEKAAPHVLLRLTLPGGATEEVRLEGYAAFHEGRGYTGSGLSEAAGRLIYGLLFSPDRLQAALAEAEVTAVIRDLPGAQLRLTAAQKAELAAALRDARPAPYLATPQPLEDPFPRYGLRLRGEGWQGLVQLRGEQHVALERWSALRVDERAGRLLTTWLPVGELPAGSLERLYLAERLEMEGGGDLTRWKQTVVRNLLGLGQTRQGTPTYTAPIRYTFYLDGQAHRVDVDREGFEHAGSRYLIPNLTDMAGLAGVP